MKRDLLLGIAATLCLTPAAAAQQTSADTLPRYLLEEVTITVTRSPVERTRSTRKVDVVSATDLDRTPASDLTDVLKKNAALDVIQFPGLLSGVSIRGFRPQYSGINPRTLILLDGRPAGANNLATLQMTDVERIEIMRGPASALYGSSAMGGVVNVITRRSEGPLHGSAMLGYGSFDTRRAELIAGGRLTPALDFDLAVASFGQHSGYRTGSNRMLGGEEVVKMLDGGEEERLPELVRDTTLHFSENSHASGSLRVGYELSAGWRVDARGSRFHAAGVQNPGDLHAGYDSRSVKDVERASAELGLSGVAGPHALLARVYVTGEQVDYFDRPDGSNFVNFRTPTRWTGFQLQDAITLGGHSLVMGIDHAAAEARSERFVRTESDDDGSTGEIVPAAPYSPHSSIASSAAFAEARLEIIPERLTGTLGGRLDRVVFDVRETELLTGHAANRENHLVFNPSIGLRYGAASGFSLRASAGRAFVTPDAFNVAGYSETAAGPAAVRVTRGNPELRPESSVSWDVGIGLNRPLNGLQAELTYFHTDVRDRITLSAASGSGLLTPGGDTIRSISTYGNVDEAEIRGVEATLGYDLGALTEWNRSLRLFMNASRILRAEEITGGTRSPILNVAERTVNAGVEFDDLRSFATRLSARYVGERRDTDFSDWMNPGTIIFPSFVVMDAAADLRLRDRYTVGARVENLMDENYYEARGYPLPGRALRLQVGVSF